MASTPRNVTHEVRLAQFDPMPRAMPNASNAALREIGTIMATTARAIYQVIDKVPNDPGTVTRTLDALQHARQLACEAIVLPHLAGTPTPVEIVRAARHHAFALQPHELDEAIARLEKECKE